MLLKSLRMVPAHSRMDDGWGNKILSNIKCIEFKLVARVQRIEGMMNAPILALLLGSSPEARARVNINLGVGTRCAVLR